MDLEHLRSEIWQQIGEPTDLDPASDVQYEGGPLLTWVANEAPRQVAFWKDPETGKVFRYPQLYGEMFFQAHVLAGTLADQSAAASNQVVLPAGFGDDDDQYNGWLVEIGSDVKLIVDYEGSSMLATVQEAYETQPASGDAVSLYARYQLLVNSGHAWASEHIVLPEVSDRFRTEGNFLEIVKLENVTSQEEILLAPRTESFSSDMLSTGDADEYYRRGNRLYFNRAWTEEKWLRMEYFRAPTDMVADSDEPELPEQLHYGIVLWGTWWGFRRAGDNASAYSVKMDLKDYMRRTIFTGEIRDDRRNDYGRLARR